MFCCFSMWSLFSGMGILKIPSPTEPLENLALDFGIIAESREPRDVALAAKPGHLTLGVAPCRGLRLKDGLFIAHRALEVRRGLPVSQRLQRFGPQGRILIDDPARFLGQPGGKHSLHAPLDAL